MQTIYMDNAATSFPKAPGVAQAMAGYLEGVGANVSRGEYGPALEAGTEMLSLRQALCRQFNADDPAGCILTPGATYGLNMTLKGLLCSGDHVVAGGLEHNAVMRPLRQIDGLAIGTLPCNADGTARPDDLAALLRKNTRLVCISAVSNVCGTILPIGELGAICRQHGVPLVVDGSQAVGHIPLDCEAMHIDALIFSAHKGLLGPQGIGAALLSRTLGARITPFVTGGTGSHSELENQPVRLPDKLEAGTPNLPGVYGFLAALRYFATHEADIAAHEKALIQQFLAGLKGLQGIRLLGLPAAEGRTGIFALDFTGWDNGDVAAALAERYGILTRCGLHCAPAAHRTLGSFPQGAVRFSIGWHTHAKDVAFTLNALRELLASHQGVKG